MAIVNANFADVLEPALKQLMDNAYLTSSPTWFYEEVDEMRALFDLADEAQPRA